MRIVLKKGKQKELVTKAKSNFGWEELGKKLNYNPTYIRNELRNEKVYLSEKTYNRLCRLIKENFDYFLIKKLNENWGQIKGGSKSPKNTKDFLKPNESEELAELFGIILGDGHVEEIKKDKKIRCYSITITGNSLDDKEYILNNVSNLFNKLLGGKGKVTYSKKRKVIFLRIHGKKLIEFIKSKGVLPGNKKLNNQGIPKWIKKNNLFLEACLRGLIDTDGSVHYISKKNLNIRISFTSYIPNLIQDVHKSFFKLKFKTSKIIRGKEIFISKKTDVKKYIERIGFSNQKHLKRLKFLEQNAPVV